MRNSPRAQRSLEHHSEHRSYCLSGDRMYWASSVPQHHPFGALTPKDICPEPVSSCLLQGLFRAL